MDRNNYVKRFKARWVICGNCQRPGIDFTDTSAPVPTDPAIRMFWSMITIKKKCYCQVNIIIAYLHAVMRERKVYIRPPPGFAIK
jgi:hypothetical protein